MSQGRRQRLKKARVLAALDAETRERHAEYDKRDAIVQANKAKPRERDYPIRTSISAIMCGYNGKGEGSVKPQWGYTAGKRREIARMPALSINTKEFVDNS